MEAFSSIITSLENWIWGAPMLILLCGTHIFMTLRTGFIQKKTFTGIRLSVTKDPDSPGDVSQFQALTTALASTIGTGNIVGVGIRVLGHGQPDAGEGLSLNKARAQGHEHVRAEQQHDHGQTPQPAVEGIDHLGELLHFYTHPFVALRAAAEGKKGARLYRPAPLRNNISIIPDSEPKIKSRL